MESKKYGLQIRVSPSQHQRKPPPRQPKPIPFDDDVEREISRQASKNKSLRDIEEQHKKALEEDPSVFDYDGVYDEMKVKAVKSRVEDRQECKPKYIQALMEKAKQREREHEIVYDRKLAKERSKEDHLYADKDKFVTSAYKRKLAEHAKWLEEERLRELIEEKDEVSKKSDISNFYFNLSKNVAFGATSTKLQIDKKPEKEPVPSPATRGHSPAVSPGTSPSRSQERSLLSKLIQVLSKSRVLLQHLFLEAWKQRSRLALINPNLTIKKPKTLLLRRKSGFWLGRGQSNKNSLLLCWCV